MKRKTTRLTFTEEELANPNIRRAAKKAARAAGRAEKAKAKLSTRAPPKRGLKMDTDKAKERSAQLRFGKADLGKKSPSPSAANRARRRCWAAKHTVRWTSRTRMKTPACRPPTRGSAWPRARPKS